MKTILSLVVLTALLAGCSPSDRTTEPSSVKPPISVNLLSLSQISYSDSTGTHPAPVTEAYVKYAGAMLSVQGFISGPGVPPELTTRPNLGLHVPANPKNDGKIALSGLTPPERGKQYIAIGRIVKTEETYSLEVTEWKKVTD